MFGTFDCGQSKLKVTPFHTHRKRTKPWNTKKQSFVHSGLSRRTTHRCCREPVGAFMLLLAKLCVHRQTRSRPCTNTQSHTVLHTYAGCVKRPICKRLTSKNCAAPHVPRAASSWPLHMAQLWLCLSCQLGHEPLRAFRSLLCLTWNTESAPSAL